jgi:peptidoglycan/xylan/chitin deacetylase (PgdA/CDA1 family)
VSGPSASADLAALARRAGLALVYHATFAVVPRTLAGGLHNVAPEILERQLAALARHFRFVEVDEFAAARDPAGLACISADDGYRCVLDDALPVFESLGVPLTMYVTGTTLEGLPFWRDQVRVLINEGLVDEFLAGAAQFRPPPGRSFYRWSKDPRVDSEAVAMAVGDFLERRGLGRGAGGAVVARANELPRHPLLSYGNHSCHHYVMASLDRARQGSEIERAAGRLAALPGLRVSECFAIPFGGDGDYNDDTVELARELGYRGLLLSRGALQTAPLSILGMPAVERFMPAASAIERSIPALPS